MSCNYDQMIVQVWVLLIQGNCLSIGMGIPCSYPTIKMVKRSFL